MATALLPRQLLLPLLRRPSLPARSAAAAAAAVAQNARPIDPPSSVSSSSSGASPRSFASACAHGLRGKTRSTAQMPPRPSPPPESEFVEKFVRGSGPGGQKINKTSSAVQLIHRPTGIVVKSQETRSREQNRAIARRKLAERLDDLARGDASRAAVVGAVRGRKKASSAKKSRRKYRKLDEARRQGQQQEEEEGEEEGEEDEEGEEEYEEEGDEYEEKEGQGAEKGDGGKEMEKEAHTEQHRKGPKEASRKRESSPSDTHAETAEKRQSQQARPIYLCSLPPIPLPGLLEKLAAASQRP
ncbi:RF-1 domain-containing protein [Xylariaceae sp. FL0804]|nr:RF-1 domain-containing protein [Xylariaceae sp. FL0804]